VTCDVFGRLPLRKMSDAIEHDLLVWADDEAPRNSVRVFNRPGVGILAEGDDAVLVIDTGASVVRRVSFDGQSSVIDGLSGSAVALGRAANGDLLVGTWGSGNIYRVAWPKS
jgi:hypothetical protein